MEALGRAIEEFGRTAEDEAAAHKARILAAKSLAAKPSYDMAMIPAETEALECYEQAAGIVRRTAHAQLGVHLPEGRKPVVEWPAVYGGGGLRVPTRNVADAHYLAAFAYANRAVPKLAERLGRPPSRRIAGRTARGRGHGTPSGGGGGG